MTGSVEDPCARMKKLETLAPTGSHWDHRKGGKYVVVGYCLLEASAAPAILYARRDQIDAPVWARDADEFLDGRFSLVATVEDQERQIIAELHDLDAMEDRWHFERSMMED